MIKANDVHSTWGAVASRNARAGAASRRKIVASDIVATAWAGRGDA